MSNRSIHLFKKFIATAITTGLILTAPGLRCYQVFAAALSVSGKAVQLVPGGSAAGAGIGSSGRLGGNTGLKVTLGGNLLRGALPAVAVPGVSIAPAAGLAAGKTISVTETAAGTANVAMDARVAAIGAVPAAGLSAPRATQAKTVSKIAAPTARKQSSVFRVTEGMKRVKSGKVGASSFLRRIFHNGRRTADRTPVAAGRSLGEVRGSMRINRLSRSGALKVVDKAGKEGVADFKGAADQAQAPKATKPGLWLVLGLGAAGAVGAFFAAPIAAGYLAVLAPAWIAAHAIAVTGLITAAGGLIGIAVSQYQVWRGYPQAVWGAASAAASSTFNFWTRFGRIFDAVISNRDMDAARKAPLPLNLFKYPILAWPFVLIGYGTAPLLVAGAFTYLGLPLVSWIFIGAAAVFGGAPVAFAAGLIYKALGTPFKAMFYGVRQVLYEFFPWLRSVFALIGRMIRKAVPFIGGFLWGGIRAEGVAIAVGAMTLARPIWDNVVDVEYDAIDNYSKRSTVERLPEIIGARLLQTAGLIAIAAAGITGGAIGVVVGLPYMFVEAWVTAFDKAEIGGRLSNLLAAWHDILEDEDGIGDMTETSFDKAGADRDNIGLGSGSVRLLNSLGHALYAVPVLISMAATAFIRTWARAIRFVRTGKKVEKGEAPKLIPLPEKEAPSKEAAANKGAAKKPSVWPPLILGAIGSALGAYAAYAVAGASILALSWMSAAVLGGAVVIGGAAGLAISQPAAWKGYLPGIIGDAAADAGGAFRAGARLGVSTDAALRNAEKDPNLYRDAPTGLSKYKLLAWPGVIGGYAAAGLSYLAGGLLKAVGVALQAAWKGAVVILTAGLIRRILRAIKEVILKFFPFVFGGVWGTLQGLAFTAWTGALVNANPIINVVEPKGDYKADTLPQAFGVRIAQGVGLLAALVSGIIGLAVGLVYGLPFTVMLALSRAVRWADVGGRFENFFRIWEGETLRTEAKRLKDFAEIELGTEDVKITYWQGLVRAGNILAHATLAILWAPLLAASSWLRSVYRAARYAKLRDPGKSAYDIAAEIMERRVDIPGLVGTDSWSRSRIALTFETQAALDEALKKGLVAKEMGGYPVEFEVETEYNRVERIAAELQESLKDIDGLEEVYSDSRGGRYIIQLSFRSIKTGEAALESGLIGKQLRGYDIEVVTARGKVLQPVEVVSEENKPVEERPAGERTWDEDEAKAPEFSRQGAGVAFALGLIGTVAGAAGAWVYGLPLLGLAGWWAWGALAAAALSGGAVGLAISQPAAWKGYLGVIAGTAGDSAMETFGYWTQSGERYSRAVRGVAQGKDATGGLALRLGHYGAGALSSLVWAVAGFLHGVVAVPFRAALIGARKVLESLWPWVKDFVDMLWRVAKRFFPFVAGAVGGVIVGVVGTALFGALLLGRPWFKYVAAEDIDTSSTGKWAGMLLTKVVAVIAGTISGILGLGLLFGLPAAIGFYVWGVPGLALALLTAAPFSLTLSVSMAFQLADIGGKSQRFFDLWSKGNLRAELRRVNKLTDSFEFDEKRQDGDLLIGDAWIRMANIFAGGFAASIAAVIAGLVAYPRSIYGAIKDLRAGKDVPVEDDYDDMRVVEKTMKSHSRGGRKVLSRLAGWGGVLYAAYLIISSCWQGGVWSALWHGFLYGSLGFPAGWVAGVVLGAVSGFVVGLIIWLARQLAKEPPAARPVGKN